MANNKIIVALDTPDLARVRKLIRELKECVSFFKVGLELFTSHGWKAVDVVKNAGAQVFLDLKLHDIPNTVAHTVWVLCQHEIDLFTVHTLGGLEMMQAARKAVEEVCEGKEHRPRILGVTILTSLKDENLVGELGIPQPVTERVPALADLARQAGLDGVVCSPQEIDLVKEKNLLIVTPGIRPAGSAKGDQKRTVSPQEALRAGADYIVIGRPITAAPSPKKAAEGILNSLN